MVSDVRLLPTEKATIFHIVTEARFSSLEFSWKDEKCWESFRSSMGGGAEYLASRLTHTATSFYIRFGGAFTEFSPSDKGRVEWASFKDWRSRVQSCHLWVAELRKQVDTPDLWSLAQHETALIEIAGSVVNNLPFTAEEQSEIASKLDAIGRYLLSMGEFQAREIGIIESRLGYLEDSSKRFGRKDWLNLAFSTFFGLAVSLALDPPKAHALLQRAGAVLSSLWQGVNGLLG